MAFFSFLKLHGPEHNITVIKLNQPGNSVFWGVVFLDATIENLEGNDPNRALEFLNIFAYWGNFDIHLKWTTATSGEYGFCSNSRSCVL